MQKLKALWKKDPGLFVSASAHALGFVLLVANFSSSPKLADQIETIPVEMVTASDVNQIMNGEETAKQLPTPQRRVDKVAELEERHPAPPLAEAKKDTPTPPSPDAPNDDPGRDDKSTPSADAAPPPPPPTPPARPVEKAETPLPPSKPQPKPDPVKPPPPDAEALAQKTPPPPMPPQRPSEAKPTKEAKSVPLPPEPPRKPERHEKTEPKKDSLDQVAKLLATIKPPKPAQKARAGSKSLDAERHEDFNLDKITALLDHEAPQRKASTGRALTQMASLGTASAHSDKMSPSMMAQLDGWLIDHYRGCWSYFGLGATQDYVPSVRVRMAPDGSLIGEPALLNPPSDPNLRSLADSAIRAVNRCNPMPVPERFKPYYDAWRLRVVRFDPKEMS